MKEVSVIVTCYNKGKYIAECLNSVLAQTFKDYEVVVVNDGSTDNSLDVISSFAEKYPQITVLNQNNQGVVAARNNGIKLAKGKYIYPLDGDDKIDEQCLQELVSAMNIGLGDVIYSQVEYFGNKTGLFELQLPTRMNMAHINYVTVSALFRKSDWENYGGYDINMKEGWEDWEFWLNFIEDGKSFYRINKTLFFYRIVENSRNSLCAEHTVKLRRYIRKKHHKIYEYMQRNLSIFSRFNLFFIKMFSSEARYMKKLSRLAQPKFMPTPNPKVIMTILVKNEADIIEYNLKFHKAMGVDGFIVTDNISSYSTREILQKYKNKGWILEIIDEPSQDYSQADWVHRMVMLAKNKYAADWVINVDADEFWMAKSGNLKNELSKSTQNIIYIPIFNMLDKGGHFLDNTNRIIKEMPKDIADALIANGYLCRFHQFSRQIPKTIVRASEYVHIHMGNHDADMVTKSKRKFVSDDVMIYHFNSRGAEHFRNKMITGGAAYARNMKLGRQVGEHWRYFYNGFNDGTLNLEDEYEKSVGVRCMEEIVNNKLLVSDEYIKNFFDDEVKNGAN